MPAFTGVCGMHSHLRRAFRALREKSGQVFTPYSSDHHSVSGKTPVTPYHYSVARPVGNCVENLLIRVK